MLIIFFTSEAIVGADPDAAVTAGAFPPALPPLSVLSEHAPPTAARGASGKCSPSAFCRESAHARCRGVGIHVWRWRPRREWAPRRGWCRGLRLHRLPSSPLLCPLRSGSASPPEMSGAREKKRAKKMRNQPASVTLPAEPGPFGGGGSRACPTPGTAVGAPWVRSFQTHPDPFCVTCSVWPCLGGGRTGWSPEALSSPIYFVPCEYALLAVNPSVT